jgi:hypothetical protein
VKACRAGADACVVALEEKKLELDELELLELVALDRG